MNGLGKLREGALSDHEVMEEDLGDLTYFLNKLHTNPSFAGDSHSPFTKTWCSQLPVFYTGVLQGKLGFSWFSHHQTYSAFLGLLSQLRVEPSLTTASRIRWWLSFLLLFTLMGYIFIKILQLSFCGES